MSFRYGGAGVLALLLVLAVGCGTHDHSSHDHGDHHKHENDEHHDKKDGHTSAGKVKDHTKGHDHGAHDHGSGEVPDHIAQKKCVVMASKAINPDVYVDHQGRRIYFCCDDCIDAFKGAPEVFLKKLDAAEKK